MSRRQAFTLIELLVVIAIIAILAAILFPVFAQAKLAAKKTADLSNQKQFATATHIYTSDNDDVFFTQGGKRCNGAWSFNSRVAVPADWAGALASQACNDRVLGGLGLPNNLVQPYTKSADMMTIPGVAAEGRDTGTFPAHANDKKPTIVGYNFNGLLSEVSGTAVSSPASTPVWWSGFGATNRYGNSYSHPFLICPDPNASCSFNGGGAAIVAEGAACPYENDTNNSPGKFPNGSRSGFGSGVFKTAFIFGKGMNWAFADGHAKWRTLGHLDPKTDPFSQYTTDGTPVNNAARTDAQCHVKIFRPDFQP
jgi:prepilin-type N-terminal cleavage/methylation domain-containing protein/prepilin-type processing-associated H-X9-DG protein